MAMSDRDGRTAYPSEEAALRRVEQLKRQGIWTGYQHSDGVWLLLFDPDVVR
jgi:hypothetical protein